jgi:uncharacterized phage protein (TIGR02218 family)
MKLIPTALQTHLDSGATTMCYCWKVIRQDGVVQGFTEHDNNLIFDGTTYLSSSGFTSSKVSQTLGLSVDNLTVSGVLSSDTLNEDDLAGGLYDNAEVVLYWVNWQDVSQRIIMSKGSIGEVKRKELSFSTEFRSIAHNLNQNTGRMYQRYCEAKLGDARCTINTNLSTYKGTGTIVSTTGRNLSVSGLGSFTPGWFIGGVLEFTSGANNGQKFEVKGHSAASISLWTLPTEPPLTGDTFTVIAGCSKDATTCKQKFNNIVNFQGFPYIPGNDVLQAYPVRGEGDWDGGSLFK